MPEDLYRELIVPELAENMRLDRLLARWFRDYSRTLLAKSIKAGLVTDGEGRTLRASTRLRTGTVLKIYIEGIAPRTPPPPYPQIAYEDERLVVVNKPPGLLCQPTGSFYVWALIGLSKSRWPDHRIDLVHRLDRFTSGCIALTKDREANQFLKEAVRKRQLRKEYLAITRGEIPWDFREIKAPMDVDDSHIRIRQAVMPEGKHAHTDVTVLRRQPGMSWVHCRIHTGRTHQIRVHLDHVGFPLLGDKLYGHPDEVFLRYLDEPDSSWVVEQAGAPRHALHAWRLTLPHPDGHELTVEAPVPDDMERWWSSPEVLPHDEGAPEPMRTPRIHL